MHATIRCRSKGDGSMGRLGRSMCMLPYAVDLKGTGPWVDLVGPCACYHTL